MYRNDYRKGQLCPYCGANHIQIEDEGIWSEEENSYYPQWCCRVCDTDWTDQTFLSSNRVKEFAERQYNLDPGTVWKVILEGEAPKALVLVSFAKQKADGEAGFMLCPVVDFGDLITEILSE